MMSSRASLGLSSQCCIDTISDFPDVFRAWSVELKLHSRELRQNKPRVRQSSPHLNLEQWVLLILFGIPARLLKQPFLSPKYPSDTACTVDPVGTVYSFLTIHAEKNRATDKLKAFSLKMVCFGTFHFREIVDWKSP